ncbi:hypothetical protein FYN96_22985 [Salmonella enterica]|nr:hypothetical protein [Salmonella enterica]EJT2122712.1 hypothetical protein [Salmonella enterica]
MSELMKMGKHRDVKKVIENTTKKKSTDYKRLQMNIHPEFHKMIKRVCTDLDVEMSQQVLTVLGDWLESRGETVDPEWTLNKRLKDPDLKKL